jgi:organic hydroperoxide reductase OsmC/OhrA
MNTPHLFNTRLVWKKNEEPKSQVTKRVYTKNHQILIEGKPTLDISAAKAFKGDPSKLNPEDLLLSSLTSCHMMSYLYCCTINKIDIIEYKDFSEAILDVNPDGSGKITKVILNPEVIISDPLQIELALSLHKKANELCFIANSCNFIIEHQAKCIAKTI